MRLRRAAIFATLVLTLVAGPGCGGHKLETGYVYTPLGDSTAKQRRAYYAGPFSPEARDAMMNENADGTSGPRRSGR